MVRTYKYDPKKRRLVLVSTRRGSASLGLILGTPKPTTGQQLAEGYKKLESAGKLREDRRYLSFKQIKHAIAMPETD